MQKLIDLNCLGFELHWLGGAKEKSFENIKSHHFLIEYSTTNIQVE